MMKYIKKSFLSLHQPLKFLLAQTPSYTFPAFALCNITDFALHGTHVDKRFISATLLVIEPDILELENVSVCAKQCSCTKPTSTEKRKDQSTVKWKSK